MVRVSNKEAGSKAWTRTLDRDPGKPGPKKYWTLKNIDPEKYGMNMGLQDISL